MNTPPTTEKRRAIAADLLTDLLTAQANIAHAMEDKERVLRKRGWQHTCDTPGSIWMWQKQLPDGRVVLVDKATALAWEERWLEEESES